MQLYACFEVFLHSSQGSFLSAPDFHAVYRTWELSWTFYQGFTARSNWSSLRPLIGAESLEGVEGWELLDHLLWLPFAHWRNFGGLAEHPLSDALSSVDVHGS